MSFRQGRSVAQQLVSNPDEQLIDFLVRALADGWPIEPASVVITDKKDARMVLSSPEEAEKKGQAGRSVKDILHLRMDTTKPVDLKNVLRQAKQVEQGAAPDVYKLDHSKFNEARDNYPAHKREMQTVDEAKRARVEAEQKAHRFEGRRDSRPFDRDRKPDDSVEDERDRRKQDRFDKPKDEEPKEDDDGGKPSEETKPEQHEDKKPEKKWAFGK